MRYRVLGAVELVGDDGRATTIGSRTQRLVLAVLLARRGGVVTVDELVDAVWGDGPPASAVASLRTYISRLRAAVGPGLVGVPGGYRLDVRDGELDADDAERCIAAADQAPAEAALELLDAALAAWRGRAFGDVADHDLLRAEAMRLDDLRRTARLRRAQALAVAGDPRRAAADAEALVADHPLDEACWSLLVDALVSAGRAGEGVRAAARARDALADAGLQPSAGLLGAEARALGLDLDPPAPAVLDGLATVAGETGPPPAAHGLAAGAPTGRWPASSLVGRDEDVRAVIELVGRARVVTLVGPGGVGKTRLATEVARHVAATRRWCTVELAAIAPAVRPPVAGDADDLAADPEALAAVVGAVTSALGAAVATNDPAEALARIGGLDVVVALDNAEHLLDEVATVVEAIVGGGGRATVLVTSRERLGVDGEHVRRVEPLAVGGEDAPAVRLFVERATAAGVQVRAGDDGIATVVARLDGLPLALEMAAAQLSTTSLPELVDIVERRVVELRAPRRSAAPRQRSLGALVEWSLDHLSADELGVLERLPVFAGTFTAADVGAVLGGDAVPLVRRLADRSLVTVRTGALTRFGVLQTVREAVLERRPVDLDDVRRAHAHWCLRELRHHDALLGGPGEPAARRRIVELLDEARAAHRWACEHEPATALAMSAVLHREAQSAVADEVLGWAARAIAAAGDGGDRRDLAVATASAATHAINRGEHERGIALARRSVEIAPDDAAALPGLEALGDGATYDGRLEEGAAAFAELRRRAARCGDRWQERGGAVGVALVAVYRGDPPEVLDRYVEELVAAEGADRDDLPPTSRSITAYTIGELLGDRDAERALEWYARALERARAVPSPMLEGVALVSAAALRSRTGDLAGSAATFVEAIELWLRRADRTHQLTTLRNAVVLLQRLDRPGETAELLAAVRRDVATYGDEAARLEAAQTWVRGRLDPGLLAQREHAGSQRDVEDAARWLLDELRR